MSLPGKSKGGKKKKSTQSMKTFNSNDQKKGKKDNKVLFLGIGAVLLIGVGIAIYQANNSSPANNNAQFKVAENQPAEKQTTTVSIPVKSDGDAKPVTPPANSEMVTPANPPANPGETPAEVKITTNPPANPDANSPTPPPMPVPETAGNMTPPANPNMTPQGNVPAELLPRTNGDPANPLKPGEVPAAEVVTLAINDTPHEAKLELPKLKELVLPSIMTVQVKVDRFERTGSAFLVSENGYALCPFDLVRRAQDVKVTFPDGKSYPVKEYVAYDLGRNLFLFKVAAENQKFKALPLLKYPPANGETLYIAAADNNTLFDLRAVSLIGELKSNEISSFLGYSRDGTWLQTTAQIMATNQGGAVVDAAGNIGGMFNYQMGFGNQTSFCNNITDIRDFILPNEGKTLLPLSQENIGKWETDFVKLESDIQSQFSQRQISFHEYQRHLAVDLTNTSYATTRIASMESVKLSIDDFGILKKDGSNRGVLINLATQALKTSELKLITDAGIAPEDNVMLLYIYARDSKNSDSNVKELRVQLQLIVPMNDINPYTGYAKVWQSEEINLGDVHITAANEGNLPRTAADKVKDLIASIKSLYIKSKRNAQDTTKQPEPLEQEIIKNFAQPQKPNFQDDFIKRRIKGTI